MIHVTLGEQESRDVGIARAARPAGASASTKPTATAGPRGRRGAKVLLHPDRAFLVVMTVALLSILALLPVAMKFDDNIDRKRPMYSDVLWVVWYEHQHVKHHGKGIPVDLLPGDVLRIGGKDISLAPGVSIRARVGPHGYCVRARNQYGDTTNRICYANAVIPPDPRHQT